MIDRNTTPRDAWNAADWLRQAAEVLRRIARDATPGPWRWGDPDVAGGALERHRTRLEHLPAPVFPAVRPPEHTGEAVLPGLKDPLDRFGDPVESIQPRVRANAHWITVVTPAVAEPLASLLDALAESAEQIIEAGGPIDREPYLSAVVLAQRIVEAARD
ncbi:hypothetical protein ACVGVM_10535 [Pseudonocardia bannensis]|uniref:Uncharacterized protein n=1 Tax=Pseudonocardia bannensis TaxID=630973 RepID=A0A848DPJ2_9PSEU|nr:hypothetical protein [Pseudonocardia bannensis]NMH94455.1 hypothetical protein [Pseudonocardia bannensis]